MVLLVKFPKCSWYLTLYPQNVRENESLRSPYAQSPPHITVCLVRSVVYWAGTNEGGDTGSMDKTGDDKSEETHIDYSIEQLKLLKTVGTGDDVECITDYIDNPNAFRHICPSMPVSSQTFLQVFCSENIDHAGCDKAQAGSACQE